MCLEQAKYDLLKKQNSKNTINKASKMTKFF